MQVLDYLHVVRRDDDANITQGFHFPSLETRDAYCQCANTASYLQRIQNILGISTAADGKGNVLRLDEISQLL